MRMTCVMGSDEISRRSRERRLDVVWRRARVDRDDAIGGQHEGEVGEVVALGDVTSSADSASPAAQASAKRAGSSWRRT